MIRLCGCYFCEGVTSKIVLTEDLARGLRLVSFQNSEFHGKWERRGTVMQVHVDCKGRNKWPRKPVDLHRMEEKGKCSGNLYRSRSVTIQWMQRRWHDERICFGQRPRCSFGQRLPLHQLGSPCPPPRMRHRPQLRQRHCPQSRQRLSQRQSRIVTMRSGL